MVRSTWYGVRGPHNFLGAPVGQQPLPSLVKKVVNASYYRSDCENSWYYRTSSSYYRTRRDHSCCMSQCPVHYPLNLMQISISSPELLTFFFISHNLKIQDGGGRHIGISGYANMVISVCWQCCILCSLPNLVQIYFIVTEIDALILLTFIWWRHAN